MRWGGIDNMKILKQLLVYSLLSIFALLISCNAPTKSENTTDSANEQTSVPTADTNRTTFEANITTEIGKNIRSILQDRNGYYWFGTDYGGVYRYDPKGESGKNLVLFSVNDGLCDNQIQTIQEDISGNIWFGTGAFGVSRFDGATFTTFTTDESLKLSSSLSDKVWKTEENDLWFYGGGGAFRYNMNSFVYLPFPEFKSTPGRSNQLGVYGLYATLKDKKGNVWFGTQTMGVCRYDGKSFTWFTEKGLSGPAVRALFEDKNGNLWFGNNGNGLFRYDPTSNLLTNFTKENGLSNPDFFNAAKILPGQLFPRTMARIWTINQDNAGDIWIGTIDAGAWRYNPEAPKGKNLINYTSKDGLTSDVVNVIYKDKKSELWFGTDGKGVCKFNPDGVSGKLFTDFEFK